MRACIDLPADPLIDYLEFCHAIAETVWPTGGLEDTQCIVGKIATFYPSTATSSSTQVTHYDAEQGATAFENGYSLGEFLTIDEAAQTSTGGLTFPCRLTDADRRLLGKILPDLPPLRYPISEEERAAFMAAYCAHPSRPAWVPDLVTEVTMNRRKSEQAKFKADQHRTMQQEIAAGRLVIVDAAHTPVKAPTAGTFVPRAQAIGYLERHGFAYRDPAAADGNGGESETQKEAQPAEGSNPWRPGERKLSPEDVQELVSLRNELKAANDRRGAGKPRIAFVKLTAEKFGVSRRRVSELVNEAGNTAPEEERIDRLLVGKPQ